MRLWYDTHMIQEDFIPLANLGENQEAIIASITADHREAKRLADLGLTPNTAITVIRKNFSNGPIEIKIRGSKIILGKGVAGKVLVRKP